MKNLLKTSAQRRISIIGILRDFHDWQDPNLLANLLDCTPKTILTDVDAINSDWGDKIGIEYSKAKGIRLDSTMQNKIRPLAHDIMEESESFQFLEKVYFEPEQDAEYWMRELFVSEATFYRMIRQIDDVLEKRDLVLERKPFRITAKDERWVRIFYTQVFIEKYGLDKFPFDLDMMKVLDFVTAASETFNVHLSDRKKMEYGFLAAVGIIRTAQGFYNQNKEVFTDEVMSALEPLRPLAEAAIADSRYHTDDNWYTEVSHSLFLDYFITCHDGGSMKKDADAFVNQLVEFFGTPISDQSRTKIVQSFAQIKRSYDIYPHSRMILFNDDAFFSRTAQNYYPHFSKLVQQLLSDLEKNTIFPWFTSFYFKILRVVFTDWGELTHHLDVYATKAKILVVSDSGNEHGQMVMELIKSRFYYRVELNLYEGSVWKFAKELAKAEKYDLVVTNFVVKDYPYENSLMVDDFLTEVDFEQINEVIKQVK